MKGRILAIDDEKNITTVIQAILERDGFEVVALNDSTAVKSALEDECFDVVITDLYMPGTNGMEILEYCQKNFPRLPVVIITAYGTVESAVNSLKKGAFDFITKPFEQVELLSIIQKAVATFHQRQMEPVIFLQNSDLTQGQSSPSQPAISSIVGNSAQMQEIFKMITKIANSPSTVLIYGESGTGKELVAYEVHRQSARANKPFIKINCAAIPATLIESELFGFERGAFTGAVASKPGRFELADEGTLFLDEVAEMSLEMQVKLLRVLQEHEFERVGGVSSIKVDVRILTATNKDLEVEVKAGRFREDLFYRLNVVPIRLPSLRERKEDIELLIKYFLLQFNRKLKKEMIGLTPDALSAFKSYTWPGNIRQLENVLERMILMSDGRILEAADLPEELSSLVKSDFSMDADGEPASLKEIVRKHSQSLEKDLIEKALEETHGNVTRAAEKLGLSRKGLQLKMKELGLKR